MALLLHLTAVFVAFGTHCVTCPPGKATPRFLSPTHNIFAGKMVRKKGRKQKFASVEADSDKVVDVRALSEQYSLSLEQELDHFEYNQVLAALADAKTPIDQLKIVQEYKGRVKVCVSVLCCTDCCVLDERGCALWLLQELLRALDPETTDFEPVRRASCSLCVI